MDVPNVCFLCGHIQENSVHLFLNCPYAKHLFQLGHFTVIKYAGTTQDLIDSSYHSMEQCQFELLSIIWWDIWHKRNLARLCQDIIEPAEVLEFAEHYSTSMVPQNKSNSFITKWKPPPEGLYKLKWSHLQ